jgi:hypothetical protein
VVREGRISIRKIPGEENPADVLTKLKNASDMKVKLGPVNAELKGRTDEGEAVSTALSFGSGRGGVLAVGHTNHRDTDNTVGIGSRTNN